MKKGLMVLMAGVMSLCACADTVLVFGFDNNTEPNGIQYESSDLLIDFSGAVSGTDQTNFNSLNGASSLVNFSIGAVGDLPSFGGTLTPVGGSLVMGASGGGLDSTGDSSDYFETSTEAWTFTFTRDVTLTDVNFYAPDSGQQVIQTNGIAVSGSPFSDDLTGAGIFIKSGDSLTFGYDASGTGTYGIDDFTLQAVPEPATMSLIGLAGLLTIGARRFRLRG